jgi:hypothetical protein
MPFAIMKPLIDPGVPDLRFAATPSLFLPSFISNLVRVKEP